MKESEAEKEYLAKLQRRRRSDGFLRQMLQAYDEKKMEVAAQLLYSAVEADPDNYFANFEMAKAQRSAGNSRLAIRFFEKCLEIHPKSIAVLDALTALYGDAGDAERALAMQQKANNAAIAYHRVFVEENGVAQPAINKIADAQDLHRIARKVIIRDLCAVKARLDKLGIIYSGHYSNSWLRMWEYSGAILETNVDCRMKILDAGGTGTIFSYYLAQQGCNVVTMDINADKVVQAREGSAKLGLKMEHVHASISEAVFPDNTFDGIFCICVIEHLRIEEQARAMRRMAGLLKPGGCLYMTFDIGWNAADFPITAADQIMARFVEPSGLKVVGNQMYCWDYNDLWEKNPDYIFGSLLLWKPGDGITLPLREPHWG